MCAVAPVRWLPGWLFCLLAAVALHSPSSLLTSRSFSQPVALAKSLCRNRLMQAASASASGFACAVDPASASASASALATLALAKSLTQSLLQLEQRVQKRTQKRMRICVCFKFGSIAICNAFPMHCARLLPTHKIFAPNSQLATCVLLLPLLLLCLALLCSVVLCFVVLSDASYSSRECPNSPSQFSAIY